MELAVVVEAGRLIFSTTARQIQAVDRDQLKSIRPATTEASYLLVSATNIVNKGTLIAGAAGEIV